MNIIFYFCQVCSDRCDYILHTVPFKMTAETHLMSFLPLGGSQSKHNKGVSRVHLSVQHNIIDVKMSELLFLYIPSTIVLMVERL